MTTIMLGRCRPGTRFRVPDLGVNGLLLYANECRARVRIDQPPREVEITGRNGQKRNFVAKRRHETDWAPSVPVVPIGTESVTRTRDKETTMTTKKTVKSGRTTTKKAAPKKKAASANTSKNATRPKAAPRAGKLSALDAAAQVIADSGEPMSAKELIEAMAKRKLWTSPGGKTPEATLYAAMTREIAKKGADARFQKQDRGRFVTNTSKAAPSKAAKKTTAKKATTKKAAKKSRPADGAPGPKSLSNLFKI